MSMDEKQPPRKPTGETPDEIRALFDRCERSQKSVAQADPKTLADSFALQTLFAESQFPPPPSDNTDLLTWKGHLYQVLVDS